MRVIAGKAKGTILKTPEGMQTRPTIDRVKEALFSIIQFEIEGKRILDLFGGTGQLGIEALSRGAQSAAFVDMSKAACLLIKENLKKTKLESAARVIQGDYLAFLNSCPEKYDVIFLDPPYAEVFLETAIKRIAEIDILQSDGIIVTERPLGKELILDDIRFIRSKDYRYGKVVLTIFRKKESQDIVI